MTTISRWNRLFLFCLGLAAGTTFCLKWMESDLVVNKELFTIMGLELWYSETEVNKILTSLDYRVATILRYHLVFDFAFMAAVFPGVAALCMMAAERMTNGNWKIVFFILALLQTVAWAFDITENYYLLTWLRQRQVTSNFEVFHFFVTSKWIIVIAGALLSILFHLVHWRQLVVRKKAATQPGRDTIADNP
jgi:hypothetical protein